MIRFIQAREEQTGQTWLVPDGIGRSPRRPGLGKWLTGRRVVIRALVDEHAIARVSPGTCIRQDIDEHVASLLRDNVVAEFTRLCRSTVAWWMQQRARAKSKENTDPSLASYLDVKIHPNTIHPALLAPQPGAPFLKHPRRTPAPKSWQINGHYAIAYLTLPQPPNDPPVTTPSTTADLLAEDMASVPSTLPHFPLDRLLTYEQQIAIRDALGLHRKDRQTLRLILLNTPTSFALGMSLWRLRLYDL
jgi:hypothetical protein